MKTNDAWQLEPPQGRARSTLWLWGFWIYFTAAVAVYLVSMHAPMPMDRILRCIVGILLLMAGPHQLRVARYKRATRGPYTIFGFDSYLTNRQTGWSAMIIGVVFIASGVVDL